MSSNRRNSTGDCTVALSSWVTCSITSATASSDPVSSSALLRSTGVIVTLTPRGNADRRLCATSAARADSSGTVTMLWAASADTLSSSSSSASIEANSLSGALTISAPRLGWGVTMI